VRTVSDGGRRTAGGGRGRRTDDASEPLSIVHPIPPRARALVVWWITPSSTRARRDARDARGARLIDVAARASSRRHRDLATRVGRAARASRVAQRARGRGGRGNKP
jgi:hypothetical protein